MYRVKNVPEYDGMEYSMFSDKVPTLYITSDQTYSQSVAYLNLLHVQRVFLFLHHYIHAHFKNTLSPSFVRLMPVPHWQSY